jgi:hypothetical protein
MNAFDKIEAQWLIYFLFLFADKMSKLILLRGAA